DRPFVDVFAGTGIVGMEALSRGASSALFVERDFRLIGELEGHLKKFGLTDRASIARADVYRWAERWPAPPEPATVFLSPPFRDFDERLADFLHLVAQLQTRVADGSVVVIQAERDAELQSLIAGGAWDHRSYGRNHLLFWVKEEAGDQGSGVRGQGSED